MTPALDLLLQCARVRCSRDEIAALAQTVTDWHEFWSVAGQHDLRSLCYWRLRTCPEVVPGDILGQFRQHFLRNTERNLVRTRELFRILGTLESSGIPAAAFKGPVIAWSSYESPGLREFADLDILVSRKHMECAQHLLEEMGYGMGAPAIRRLFQFAGQLEMIRDHPEVVLDLHWDLAPRSLGLSLDAETLWPRLRPHRIAGRDVLTFDDHDQLLFAAWHGGKHGWTTLSWLADLARFANDTCLNWERIFLDAREMRLSRSLLVALRLSRDLLHVELPPQVVERIERDASSAAIAEDARMHLLGATAGSSFFPRRLIYQFRLTEGWGRRLALLWRKGTEPNVADWTSSQNPPGGFGRYYVTRPLRLIAKYTRLMIERAPWNGSGTSAG